LRGRPRRLRLWRPTGSNTSSDTSNGRPAMKRLVHAISAALFALACVGYAHAQSPRPGQPAPDFRLQDQDGNWHELKDYRGKWVALYFYPKDNTPGCTTQACEFRDNIFAFREANAVILGVSVDDV